MTIQDTKPTISDENALKTSKKVLRTINRHLDEKRSNHTLHEIVGEVLG